MSVVAQRYARSLVDAVLEGEVEDASRVLDVATNPEFEVDEATRLRELLREAGLLYEPVRREPAPPIEEERLAGARRAAGKGTPLSQLVIDGRR